MAVADRHGLPVAVYVESATPHEVKLATSTLVQMTVPDAPQNLIGDNAYPSDKLDAELRQYGIELIAPHRRNRRNTTQDARRMRRQRSHARHHPLASSPYRSFCRAPSPLSVARFPLIPLTRGLVRGS